ncbi:MAG: methyltransferase domain-containing protein [Myxococcota bacterium]
MQKTKRRLKSVAGGVLARLLPGRAAAITQDFTRSYWDAAASGSRAGRLVDSLIRFHLAHSRAGRDDGKSLESIHKRFWSEKRDVEWFERSSQDFETKALPHLRGPVADLAARLAGKEPARVCEIGTGDGRFLEYLSQNLPPGPAYVGLDLSAERIELNRGLYPDFEFHSGDAEDWIRENGIDRTLYVTNGGVFEYFSLSSLIELLAFIDRTQPDSAVALFFEPIAADHDLTSELDSRLTTAGEYSFSHNYAHLLGRAGFRLESFIDDTVAGYRAITLYATLEKKSPAPPEKGGA